MKIEIDYPAILAKQKLFAKERLEQFRDDFGDGVDSRTPEDKKELVGNNERGDIIEFGNKLITSVYNTTSYVKPVEYGVQGKTYNYNKPKGNIFYVGVGAGMFRRTYLDMKDKITSYFK